MLDKTFSFKRKISAADILKFAECSHDFNPVHLNADYASKTRFKKPIAHGMLVASAISACISRNLKGAIYLNQNLGFLKPVFIGDVITVEIKVISMTYNEKLKGDALALYANVFNQDKQVVIKGGATVLLENGGS